MQACADIHWQSNFCGGIAMIMFFVTFTPIVTLPFILGYLLGD